MLCCKSALSFFGQSVLQTSETVCHHDFLHSCFHFSLPLIFIILISVKKLFLVKGGLGSEGTFNLISSLNEPNHYPLTFGFNQVEKLRDNDLVHLIEDGTKLKTPTFNDSKFKDVAGYFYI